MTTMKAQSTMMAMIGAEAQALMKLLSSWGNTTTIILQKGCVFEFKGVFPAGSMAEGYYNLDSAGQGFEGHIKLETIHQISFQKRQHRGKESYAFVFQDTQEDVIFKVFLGRDVEGHLYPQQVNLFNQIQIRRCVDS